MNDDPLLERRRIEDEVSIRVMELEKLRATLAQTPDPSARRKLAAMIAEGDAALKPLAERLVQLEASETRARYEALGRRRPPQST
jgi:hypothetical protein